MHGRDYTGSLLEETYFGVSVDRKNRKAAEDFFKMLSGSEDVAATKGFLPFQKAVRFVKTFQPGTDPTMPSTKVARDLLDFVAEELDIDPDSEEAEELKFYTAVGSPLDRFHGVDAFIEYEDKRALIDVTMNPKKRFEDSSGNRIIMEQLPDYGVKEERADYERELRKYARAVVKILRPPVEHTKEYAESGVSLR
jgi:hypothetical protein